MAAMIVTLNDLEGHSPVTGLFKCSPSNICAAFYTISTDSILARFLYISRASCSTVLFLHTVYFRLFMLSQKKTMCYSLTHHTWKMSPHYLVKCTTFTSDWRYVAFLHILVVLKKAGCGLALVDLKRTGYDVWQMECQATNITANVQSDHLLHRYMLRVIFTTDQLHRPPHSAEIQPMLQQDTRNSSVSQIGTRYVTKWKRW